VVVGTQHRNGHDRRVDDEEQTDDRYDDLAVQRREDGGHNECGSDRD